MTDDPRPEKKLPDGFIIRPVGKEDAALLAELDARCFTRDAWPASEFESSMNSFCRYFIAELEGRPVGSAGCITLPGIQGEISTIGIVPEERGRGLSRPLLERLLAECEAEDIPEVFLEVRPSNAPAIALYKKYGFTGAGLRKRYYSDGEDAVIMVRR